MIALLIYAGLPTLISFMILLFNAGNAKKLFSWFGSFLFDLIYYYSKTTLAALLTFLPLLLRALNNLSDNKKTDSTIPQVKEFFEIIGETNAVQLTNYVQLTIFFCAIFLIMQVSRSRPTYSKDYYLSMTKIIEIILLILALFNSVIIASNNLDTNKPNFTTVDFLIILLILTLIIMLIDYILIHATLENNEYIDSKIRKINSSAIFKQSRMIKSLNRELEKYIYFDRYKIRNKRKQLRQYYTYILAYRRDLHSIFRIDKDDIRAINELARIYAKNTLKHPKHSSCCEGWIDKLFWISMPFIFYRLILIIARYMSVNAVHDLYIS